MKNLIQEENRF